MIVTAASTMSSDGKYGGTAEIEATAALFHRFIVVLQRDAPCYTAGPENMPVIRLLFERRAKHYSFLKIADTSVDLIPTQDVSQNRSGTANSENVQLSDTPLQRETTVDELLLMIMDADDRRLFESGLTTTRPVFAHPPPGLSTH